MGCLKVICLAYSSRSDKATEGHSSTILRNCP
ncbi:hypothetical protein CP8484711_1131, partial [Chlamydia psittaci 84-8471/1]